MPKQELGSALPAARARLVRELRAQRIDDGRVLAAIGKLPRHEFVEDAWHTEAYKNKPLPIGLSQTISQPYIVALMTQLLLQGGIRKKVLEVGTGSGYQSAVLAEVFAAVFSVERIKPLAEQARARLRRLGYRNIHCGYADGGEGWAAHAPYDGIIVTAAAAAVPRALLKQLARGGRMVIPVGPPGHQQLRVIDRTPHGLEAQDVSAVSFVPLLPGKV